MTRSELATWIVRMGEKYPDRVGLYRKLANGNCTDHCIMGQILHDLGSCGSYAGAGFPLFDCSLERLAVIELSSRAVALNNSGTKWGEIPKLLGLVPGEGPCEPALDTAGELIAPGVVCKDQPLAELVTT